MPKQILLLICTLFFSTVLFCLAIYLLSIYKRLFLSVKNIWIRRNIVVVCIAVLIMSAFFALQSPEVGAITSVKGYWEVLLKQLGQTALIVLFVFNITWFVSNLKWVKNLSFVKHHFVVILTIILSALAIYVTVNYFDSGMKVDKMKLHATLVYAYYNSLLTGLIYTSVNYVEQQRQRKLDEKEFELTKLTALKTKAELDALHSKINPHFLYNALNSIADLAITDGRKGRKMTIALADLFRYSINYSNHNYSTIADEVEMAEVYLQIEKIRFEDQLNYTVKVEEGLKHYLVPRFILQPIVENAVKHGLKATGKMTEIDISIKKAAEGIEVVVADNGPLFPAELMPGYGVKSIFDKLDLLFPNQYEVRFINEPQKLVTLLIKKMIKDAPIDESISN